MTSGCISAWTKFYEAHLYLYCRHWRSWIRNIKARHQSEILNFLYGNIKWLTYILSGIRSRTCFSSLLGTWLAEANFRTMNGIWYDASIVAYHVDI